MRKIQRNFRIDQNLDLRLKDIANEQAGKSFACFNPLVGVIPQGTQPKDVSALSVMAG